MNELTINLHTASETPLYEQIYQHIKERFRREGLPAGKNFPPVVLCANIWKSAEAQWSLPMNS